mgnify:FL=1
MSRVRIEALEVQQLAAVLKEQAAAQPEIGELLNPKAFEIMMHPFTARIRREVPEFNQLLADIAAVEKVRRASGMDASQLLIVLGYTAYGMKAQERIRDGVEGGSCSEE